MIKRMALWSLAALLVSAGAQAQVPQPNKTAAVVNGEVIPMSEVAALLRLQPPPANPQTEKQKKEIELAACNMLVDDVLMRQFLRKNAQVPTAGEVQKAMNASASDPRRRGPTRDRTVGS